MKQAYVAALQAQALLENAIATRDTYVHTIQLNKRRFVLRAINEGDLTKIQVAALQSHQAVTQAEQTLRVAKVSVAFLLGFRTLVPNYQLDGKELDAGIPPALSRASRESLLQGALERRPDVAAFVEQEKRAATALTLSKRHLIPAFGLSATYSANGTGDTNVSPQNASVGLTFALPIFYFQHGEIVRAEADLSTPGA